MISKVGGQNLFVYNFVHGVDEDFFRALAGSWQQGKKVI